MSIPLIRIRHFHYTSGKFGVKAILTSLFLTMLPFWILKSDIGTPCGIKRGTVLFNQSKSDFRIDPSRSFSSQGEDHKQISLRLELGQIPTLRKDLETKEVKLILFWLAFTIQQLNPGFLQYHLLTLTEYMQNMTK